VVLYDMWVQVDFFVQVSPEIVEYRVTPHHGGPIQGLAQSISRDTQIIPAGGQRAAGGLVVHQAYFPRI
jgi:hypothetical protein